MPPRRRLRLGLIGLGKHGSRYARHIRDDLPGVELAAISRQDPEKLAAAARELGARPFVSYRELIREGGVDAVVAVVPPTLHLDIVRIAAAAGMPVLLEKPAAPSLRAGRAILAVLGRHPVPVMVAQTLRYNAVVRVLLAERRRLGRVRSLTFTQRFEPSRLAWLDDPERSGGGVGLHTAVHAFDLMRIVTGMEADDVTCQVESVHTERTEDNFVATVRLGGGAALATVACSRAAGGRNGHLEVAGEKGTLIGDHVLHQAHLVVGTRIDPLAVPPPVPTVREVVRDFALAVRRGSPVPIPFAEGLRAVALAEASATAARTGRRTAVASVAG
jgi:predicted dehydrogenase